MTEQLSFIHAADLHLDSPFQGMASVPENIFKQIQVSTFNALDNLVKTAISKKVDFILLVGDLFDNERQSLKAQIKLKKAFEELNRYDIKVYLSYGNHDFVSGNTYPVVYPDNVYIFNEEKVNHFTFTKQAKSVANIYGFSYENRSVLQNKTAEFKLHNQEVPFHIAMLHGSLISNTEHDTYAPFYLSELTNKEFDYWALGHIHKPEMLKQNPPIVYSGNTQGRNRKETGARGCYHVVLNKSQTDVCFLPLQAIQFNTLLVDVSNCTEPHALEEVIRDTIQEQKYEVPQLLSVELKGTNPALNLWVRDGLIEDTIELLNDTLMTESRWDFIFRYTVKIDQSHNENELRKGEHFIGELLRHSEDAPIHTYMEELYRHKQARKYIEPITKIDDVRQQAKQLLVNELLKGED
ncbi:metallophosphoesterase family protein [Virgibacillus necropolis]|uniref:DNA repair exonuclease n=1 Tax=Virgibacillus necropolis TaxID=163877 RepID=A0A221MG05_9BACI|nr:DNA repair exonuclease [Virgibacillus necropolis]ASN06598.1 DNA repair exonuclease [Virgibacillus necropolis]